MLVRRIRSRVSGKGVGVVEANGEVLFAPGTDLSRWKNRFSQRVREATATAAPTNKRPRWDHYGKALKQTITASTSTRITKGGGFFYIAVGSSAPHAYYVDQGTGIYGGNGPYEAKILPPWTRGSPSLYEHTWRPGGAGTRKVRPVMIKGQKGQGFFDTGLKRGFQSMRMRSFQVPGEGVSGMTSALASFPSGLLNFAGNTASDGPFKGQLAEWREWRDEAWGKGDMLGKKPRRAIKPGNVIAYEASIAASKRRAAAQLAAIKDQKARKAEGERKRKERDRKLRESNALRRGNKKMLQQATKFYEAIRQQYPNATIRSTTLPDGVVVYRVSYVVNGETIRQQWAYGYDT
jgi:hypothetical protein